MTKLVSYVSDEAIEKDAQALLAEYAHARGVPIEAPIAIDDIIEKHLKIGIEFDDTHRLFGVPRSGIGFDPDILGAIFFDQKRIVIDESLDPDANRSKEGRYRYTAAHEVGHWRLHRGLFSKDPAQTSLLVANALPSVICRSSQAKARIELQADIYASCLLMPRNLVFAAWDEAFPDRKQRVLQPFEPMDHPFVEIARASSAAVSAPHSPKTTIRRSIASLRSWPNGFSFRRSRCASGLKSSGCCTARFRFSGFCPIADPLFEEIVKCQLNDRTLRRTEEAPRSRRGISISPVSCAASATSF
jgi:IrrE N-terminal-like domain